MKKESLAYSEGYNLVFKKYVKCYLYITTAVVLALSLILWPELLFPLNLIVLTLLVAKTVCILVSNYLQFPTILPIIHLYIMIIWILIFPIALFFLEAGDISICIWYAIIPIAVYVVLPINKVKYWTWYAVIHLSLICVLLALFKLTGVNLHELYYGQIEESHLVSEARFRIAGGVSFFFFFGLVALSIYFIYKIQTAKWDELYERIRVGEDNEVIQEMDDFDEAKVVKYDEIYSRIAGFIETHQSYTNPDFTITQLALSMKVNTTYISAAIRAKRNMNFSTFVNIYRVESVKKLIQSSGNKYTIEHIYLISGFRNQSTFNKAFKISEGITPSKYIKKHTPNAEL